MAYMMAWVSAALLIILMIVTEYYTFKYPVGEITAIKNLFNSGNYHLMSLLGFVSVIGLILNFSIILCSIYNSPLTTVIIINSKVN
jgi:hypothetical protein